MSNQIQKEIPISRRELIRQIDHDDFVMDIYMHNNIIIMWRKDVLDDFTIILPNDVVIQATNGYRAKVSTTNYNEALYIITTASDSGILMYSNKLGQLPHNRQKEEELLTSLGYPLKIKNKENHLAIYYSDISHQLVIKPYLLKNGNAIICFEDGFYEPCK